MSADPIGLSLSSRADLTACDFVSYAAQAEEAGAGAVFATETSSDALALAQAMAIATSHIQVGTAITNIRWRHPALAAAGAAAAAQLSAGRFVLGLGVANPGFNEGQLGLDPVPPLAAMREYVQVVRAALSGDPVHTEGQVHRLDGFTATASGVASVPIWVGALQPGMLRLAGEVGDGALLNLSSPAMVADAVFHVREGTDATDRDPADVRIACVIPCALSDDPDAARVAARQMVAGYTLHPAASSLFAAAAADTDITAVAQLMRTGDVVAAADLVDDAFADQLVVTDADLDGVLAPYRTAGVDLPILFPVPVGGSWTTSIEMAINAIRAHSRRRAPVTS